MRHPFAYLGGFLAAFAGAPLRGAISPDEVAALFRPFVAEQATLSPDGRQVAYTDHVREELRVVIMKLEPPYSKVTLAMADDEAMALSKEKQRPTLRFLRWATSNRLVLALNQRILPVRSFSGPQYFAPVQAVDADGRNPLTLIEAADYITTVQVLNPAAEAESKDVTRASEVVGFAAGDRDHVLVQALGYEFRSGAQAPVIVPTTLFKVDVHTGAKSQVGDEFFLGGVGYDRQGRSRISYIRPLRTPERSFAVSGSPALKLNEPWLGPLAGRFTLNPQNYFGERAYPLGFDTDPDVLYIASNVGRDTFGVYALNLKTRRRVDVALEHPYIDLAPLEPRYPARALVFDEARGTLAGIRSSGPQPVSVWLDTGLAATQRTLDQQFPRRTVEILEWADDRSAFLVRITGGTEPGRYFIHQPADHLTVEILRRAPWLHAADLHPSEPFEFVSERGVHLSGYVTLPRTSRLNPPPAVICFAEGFPAAAHPEFSREAQVLAGMGVVVIRLNHRGVGGFGRSHRDAILGGIDRAPIDDALATLDWMARRHPIDRKRVATMGSGFGGYLAVRALQLYPEAFRCGVAFNAPLDPALWLQPPVDADMRSRLDFPQEVNRAFLQRSGADLIVLGVTRRPETLTQPVFLLVDAGRSDAIGASNFRLRDQLRRADGEVTFVEPNPDFAAELPAARTRVYQQLEEFFNLNLYNYKVKVGETKEVK